MCDTLVKKTIDGFIFGKNSDRSPNEPNLTLFFPKRNCEETTLRCTYLEIPQVAITNAVLLVKPSWMWGAEMGVNEAGVVIGNEAVFTRTKGKKTNRLIGMDFLRLALERTDSAETALQLIIELLKKYGQGGNCGFDKPFYYDNSYLIADAKKAFILETAGTAFTFKEVTDHGNISNRLSLHQPDMSQSEPVVDFVKHFSEPVFTHFSQSKSRSSCASSFLKADQFDLRTLSYLLRSHVMKDEPDLYVKGSVASVCMHKSLLGDHTTGSLIVQQRKHYQTLWITGSSTPCLSLYKPVFFGQIAPPVFTSKEDSLAYWLDHEYLVRAIYSGLIDEAAYKTRLNELQEELFQAEQVLYDQNPDVDALHKFGLKAALIDRQFTEGYRSAIDQVKAFPELLPGVWGKKTVLLGKNVFSSDLTARTSK